MPRRPWLYRGDRGATRQSIGGHYASTVAPFLGARDAPVGRCPAHTTHTTHTTAI